MVGQALIISIDAEISDYLTVLGSTRGMPGLTLLLVKRYFSIWLEKLKYITLLSGLKIKKINFGFKLQFLVKI